jgi:hypothetical protein
MSTLTIVPGDITKVNIYGQSTGSIAESTTVGGSGVVVYTAWTYNTGEYVTPRTLGEKTGLKAGTYVLNIVDSLGETASHTFEVPQNPVITITPGAITRVLIYGQSTGGISLSTVSGGDGTYTYMWSTEDETLTVPTPTTLSAKTGLKKGVYRLTVTDGVGATAFHDFDITENQVIKISEGVVKNVPFYGTGEQINGSVEDLTVSGGTGTYTYAWTVMDGNGTVPNPTVLEDKSLRVGKYKLTVTDSATATANRTFTVIKNPQVVRSSKRARAVR